MVQVRATSRGYFGGELREVGDRFEVPDDLWEDKKRRPKWAQLAAFGGKGDHDGDGFTGGSKPADAAGDDDQAEDGKPKKGKGKGKGKAETVEQPTAEPFADAPAPTTVPKGGIQEAIGGAEPDWLPPSDDKPVPADD